MKPINNWLLEIHETISIFIVIDTIPDTIGQNNFIEIMIKNVDIEYAARVCARVFLVETN